MAKIRIKRIDKDLPLPEFDEADPKTLEQYDKSQVAAFDLFCREDKTIPPHELALVAVNDAAGLLLATSSAELHPMEKRSNVGERDRNCRSFLQRES